MPKKERKRAGGKFFREHSVWHDIKNRCSNPKDRCFHNYGGRGICVCRRWLNSFQNFLEDMGSRPSDKHSIERIDVNGNYGPKNCKWATSKEQNRNRRDNINITFNGKTQCLAAWAEEFDIEMRLMWARINVLGWSMERCASNKANSYVEMYTHNGVTKSLRKWCKELGIKYWLINQRRNRDGMSLEQAMSRPITKQNYKNE